MFSIKNNIKHKLGNILMV